MYTLYDKRKETVLTKQTAYREAMSRMNDSNTTIASNTCVCHNDYNLVINIKTHFKFMSEKFKSKCNQFHYNLKETGYNGIKYSDQLALDYYI